MDNKSKALGYLVGRQIAGMRRVIKEPVAWLYNGVRLPKLPECDREMYPYALISDRYSLEPTVIMTSMPFSEPHENFFGAYVAAPECLYTRYVLDNGKWVLLNEPTILTSASENYTDLVWSNYDIPGLDGSVYLAGSDPIPVYE